VTILFLVILPLLLLAFGTPIFVALLAACVAEILYRGDMPVAALHTAIFGGLDSFSLLAVPLFILAGDVMARGGIARRLFTVVLALIGGVRGSLAVSTIAASALFGAVSGSSVACVASIGKLVLPSLEKNGYGRAFSVSLVTATGVIDVIIPPSIPMVIYGIAAQVSVTRLFLAGIVPGLIIAACLSAFVLVRPRTTSDREGGSENRPGIVEAWRKAFWAILAPVVVLGGIYGGIFTPTEAAGVAVVYAILVSVLIHRELDWAEIWQILKDSSLLAGQVMMIVAAAGAYGWILTTSGVPSHLVAAIDSMALPTWVLLLVINLMLLLVGSALEPPAAILVLTPLLMPIVTRVGLDPIHFGLIMTVNLAIGLFMPPFGLNLFASHAMFGTPIPVLYRGVLPFLVIYLAVLMLVTYVPAITLAPLALFR
jgi:C4-dicarboxylate transporter, DctM subunit